MADPGKWNTEGLVLGYQWRSDRVDIIGATSSTLRPTAALAGNETVAAANSGSRSLLVVR